MSFVCSDSCEIGITREKVLAKCSGKLPFLDYLGFQSELWNFQCVKCLDKHVEQDDGRKSGAERQNSKKGSERMRMPAAWREFS